MQLSLSRARARSLSLFGAPLTTLTRTHARAWRQAFEKCGPKEVLVMASVGPWESVGGDIKFLRLQQRNIGGLVTDGSV